jgi:predicted amidohydrolase
MRAIAIQLEPGADKSDNIRLALDQIGRALSGAASGATLVSLPEMWTYLGADRATKLRQSEVLPPSGGVGEPGSAYAVLSETAAKFGIFLHGGSIGECDGDTVFNTTLVFGPDGAEIARYRKIHLFDVVTPNGQGYRESAMFGAGDKIVTCRIGDLTLGLSICYDLRFPELFLALRRAGADAIVVPSAFTAETGRDHWEVLLRARAIETQCYIVAAATTGTHHDATGRPRHTYGHSLICDPWGQILASQPENPGFVSASLDLARLAQVRAAMPVLDHRRLA